MKLILWVIVGILGLSTVLFLSALLVDEIQYRRVTRRHPNPEVGNDTQT